MVTNSKNKEEEEINFNIVDITVDDDINFNLTSNGETKPFVTKRNKLLYLFFKEIIFPDKDVVLLGDENNPAVIIDNQTLISCYVKNFFINFMDKNRNANLVFSVKLNDVLRKTDYPVGKILDWYKEYEHRKIYRLYLETKNDNTEPPLLLVGWNYKNKEKKQFRYPVFGEYNPKIYITKEKAIEVEKELKDGGYNVIII